MSKGRKAILVHEDMAENNEFILMKSSLVEKDCLVMINLDELPTFERPCLPKSLDFDSTNMPVATQHCVLKETEHEQD